MCDGREKYAAMKPVSMSFSEAAGIPLAGLTSYEALLDSNMGALVDGQVGMCCYLCMRRGTVLCWYVLGQQSVECSSV